MKKAISLFTLFFVCQSLIAQTTMDPKVTRKSSYDVYINKILIDDNYTVVSMKFVSKSVQQQIEDFFRQNPEAKKYFDELDKFEQENSLRRLRMRYSTMSNTISFQPSSYLLSEDGRRFKFVKASSIPVSPDRIEVEAGERYYFKVYFEKLDPGVESIDIIENNSSENDGFSYWNFYGVEVNNPRDDVQAFIPESEEPTEKIEEKSTAKISLTGMVLNAETEEPIPAKIVCVTKDPKVKFDSVITSRSGRYEFIVPPDDYLYTISAAGYEASEESFDLSFLKSDKSFTRNFYLTPLPMTSEVPPLVVDKIEEKVTEEASTPVEVEENTFRLDKVYFSVGQSTILPDSYSQLEGLVKMMRDNPAMKIQVVGHTDNQGDSKLNKKLSLRRAFEVRKYLISKGVNGKRIKFKGMGDAAPIAQNDTEENRSKNRRVEFIILEE